MKKVFEILTELSRTEFYGSLVLKFDKGRIVLIKKEQNIKPE